MKNLILKALPNYVELKSEDIMELNEQEFINSAFKTNLNKDKQKNAKVSENKFYLKNNDVIIKFEYDDQTCKMAIFVSKDNNGTFIKTIEQISADIKVIVYDCNEQFVDFNLALKENDYSLVVRRKEKFLNNGKYNDNLIFEKVRGET